MSTRSLICKEMPNGKIYGIYCHMDGYPEHVGYLLFKYFSSRKKLDELLALGDIHNLGKDIMPHNGNGTIALHRDYGEEMHPLRQIRITKAWEDYSAEWIYIFGQDSVWRYAITPCKSKTDFAPLTTEICYGYT